LAVATVLPRVIPAGRTPGPGRRDLVLRAIGYRPSGGVAHRPMLLDNDEDPDLSDSDVPGM
jgi:hypothetical protein